MIAHPHIAHLIVGVIDTVAKCLDEAGVPLTAEQHAVLAEAAVKAGAA